MFNILSESGCPCLICSGCYKQGGPGKLTKPGQARQHHGLGSSSKRMVWDCQRFWSEGKAACSGRGCG